MNFKHFTQNRALHVIFIVFYTVSAIFLGIVAGIFYIASILFILIALPFKMLIKSLIRNFSKQKAL
jgi:hypothetical protein